MEEQDVVRGGNRLADAVNVRAGQGADVAEAVDVDSVDHDVATHSLFVIEGIEAIAAGLGPRGTKEVDVPHLRQRLHPGDVVAAVDPIVVPFHGDAGYAGVFQRLQGLNGPGKGTGEDLASVEEVAGDEDKIHLLGNGIRHNSAEHAEEVFVAFSLAGGGAIGFAEVDVGGVEKSKYHFHHQLPRQSNQ